MKFSTLKELIKRDLAVSAMSALHLVIRIVDKFTKHKTADLKLFKIKTNNYHVRLFVDVPYERSFILAKKRGFFKDWKFIEKKDLPKCLVEDVFEDSCTEEKRRRLVTKIVELKAFW